MDLIIKWLSGKRNFYVGAVLYKQYGIDERLKKLFEAKPDQYSQRRLEEELSALLEKPKQKPAPVRYGDADEMPISNDPMLKAFREEWLPVYQRMNYLRHELDRYEGNSQEAIAKREPIAFEVLDLEQKCMVIWARRGHYEKNGRLPEVKELEEEIPSDPIELNKLIDATKRNIRRNKQLSEKHPDNAVYPLRYKEYTAKLEAIMKKVNDGKQSA
jgi:hypothetical protein